MSRRFIRQGDKTDHNGAVVEAIAGTVLQGQPFTYFGALVQRPACSTTGVIISDGSPRTMTMMGKQIALENDCANANAIHYRSLLYPRLFVPLGCARRDSERNGI